MGFKMANDITLASAPASSIYTITVEPGMTLSDWTNISGTVAEADAVDHKDGNVYYMKSSANITGFKVKTTNTRYAFVTDNPAQANMCAHASVAQNDCSTAAQSVTMVNPNHDAYVFGAVKMTMTNIRPDALGFDNEKYHTGTATLTINGVTFYTDGVAYVKPGTDWTVNLDINDDGVAGCVMSLEGTNNTWSQWNNSQFTVEDGLKDITLNGAFKVTLKNGVTAKVGGTALTPRDGKDYVYVVKDQTVDNIAVATADAANKIAVNVTPDATGNEVWCGEAVTSVANIADNLTIDAFTKVTLKIRNAAAKVYYVKDGGREEVIAAGQAGADTEIGVKSGSTIYVLGSGTTTDHVIKLNTGTDAKLLDTSAADGTKAAWAKIEIGSKAVEITEGA